MLTILAVGYHTMLYATEEEVWPGHKRRAIIAPPLFCAPHLCSGDQPPKTITHVRNYPTNSSSLERDDYAGDPRPLPQIVLCREYFDNSVRQVNPRAKGCRLVSRTSACLRASQHSPASLYSATTTNLLSSSFRQDLTLGDNPSDNIDNHEFAASLLLVALLQTKGSQCEIHIVLLLHQRG